MKDFKLLVDYAVKTTCHDQEVKAVFLAWSFMNTSLELDKFVDLPKFTTSNTLEDLSSATVHANSPLLLTFMSSILPVIK